MTTKATRLEQTFAQYGLTQVFVEELGWDAPTGTIPVFHIDDDEYRPATIAELKGFRIYAVPTKGRPTRKLMRQIDAALSELSPERLEIFQSPEAWYWHWPRRTNGGTTSFEAVETSPNALPTFLAQRLSGLEFTIADHRRGLTLPDVRARVQGHFDASNVTKKFYTRFRQEHEKLAETITGVSSDESAGYATTLLNRLMFLYFMQKKEFLNSDQNYLENTLKAVQKLQGRDKYYNFYRDALLPLFFDKLNDRDGAVDDPEIATILGDVPYVNGGIFGHTDLEIDKADKLGVPDKAFEEILTFFSEFNWHLDTRPTGNPDEINPEVIGYIFEQYINFTASGKKNNGAYYTPHDVTAHMIAQTLVPRILDDFEQIELVFKLLRESPDRYIQPAMLHGWSSVENEWIQFPPNLEACWNDDPIGWGELDEADRNDELLLPGETWVEAFYRRERVALLRNQIVEGKICEINDIITQNLNGQLLLTDAIDRLEDGEQAVQLFKQLTTLSIFDPTCGSGAFLFAALEVLEDIYDHVIDAMAAAENESAVAGILAQVKAHPSKRYFIRKHAAIRNLYGTDLMPGAVETAKLRIFLALAACIDSRSKLEPLPDLDFNLKTGNLVVGFKDTEDVHRVGGDLLTESKLAALKPKIDEYADLYATFSDYVEEDNTDAARLKKLLRKRETELRDECNAIYADASFISATKVDTWIEDSRPFHWFCEFPEMIRRGGFDVVIGNPPYVRMRDVPGYSAKGYLTSECPDLYAVCYERSLSLTSPRGRHAFIVMLNLSFADRFGPLREVIGKRDGAEWWSTYGKWPTQLFAGVRVANTLVILGPGESEHVTRHFIFGPTDRAHLFQTIEHHRFRRSGEETPVRGGIVGSLLRQIDELPLPESHPPGDSLYVRPTGQYWFPVLFGAPPVLDSRGYVIKEVDSGVNRIQLSESESRLLAGATLAGKIAYAWWSAVGDDFHFNPDETQAARKLAASVEPNTELIDRAEAVRDAGRTAAFVSKNNDGYVNVRWSSVRGTTDEFDRALLESAGLLKHWKPLNIWYRQCMRSTRANYNSRMLTTKEVDQFLKW